MFLLLKKNEVSFRRGIRHGPITSRGERVETENIRKNNINRYQRDLQMLTWHKCKCRGRRVINNEGIPVVIVTPQLLVSLGRLGGTDRYVFPQELQDYWRTRICVVSSWRRVPHVRWVEWDPVCGWSSFCLPSRSQRSWRVPTTPLL
jgi:hypothetical protein